MIRAALASLALATAGPAYPARFLACYDGDTCSFLLTLEDETRELGMGIFRKTTTLMQVTTRLCGINAPELHTSGGPKSQKALATWLKAAKSITVETFGREKYGRTLARITADGVDLGRRLLAEGLAVSYEECR